VKRILYLPWQNKNEIGITRTRLEWTQQVWSLGHITLPKSNKMVVITFGTKTNAWTNRELTLIHNSSWPTFGRRHHLFFIV
jgi:hypothetical protein